MNNGAKPEGKGCRDDYLRFYEVDMILLLFPRRELRTYPSSHRCLYAPANAPGQAPRVGYGCGSVTQVSREPTRVLTKSFHLRLGSPMLPLPGSWLKEGAMTTAATGERLLERPGALTSVSAPHPEGCCDQHNPEYERIDAHDPHHREQDHVGQDREAYPGDHGEDAAED